MFSQVINNIMVTTEDMEEDPISQVVTKELKDSIPIKDTVFNTVIIMETRESK